MNLAGDCILILAFHLILIDKCKLLGGPIVPKMKLQPGHSSYAVARISAINLFHCLMGKLPFRESKDPLAGAKVNPFDPPTDIRIFRIFRDILHVPTM